MTYSSPGGKRTATLKMASTGFPCRVAGRDFHFSISASPASAMMLASRIFYNYFSVEILFGVKDHFGKDTESVVSEISRILRHGMLR